MEAAAPSLPEFDAVRNDPVAAPLRRSWHFLAEAVLGLGEAGFEHTTIGQNFALRRGPGAEPACHRPGREIGVGLRGLDFLRATFDANLAFQLDPMEQQ